ncbi:hypothetical protein JX266_007257 [Neoarthrinium moseri]|nr:hypothetical protein JX266_007257 [Neoarthrinium moseri]
MFSIEQTSALSQIDTELDELVASGVRLPPAWTLDSDVSSLRDTLKRARRARGKSPGLLSLPFIEQDRQIKVRDGTSIAIRVTSPHGPRAKKPGLLMIHGGGHIVGDLDAGSMVSHTFARLGGVAVTIDYRLAPEHPFPTGIHDSFDALVWMTQNLADLDVDPRLGFLIAGESSGSDIALTIAHLWSEQESLPPLTGIYASVNSGISRDTVPDRYRDHFFSLDQNAEAPGFTIESLEFIRKNYKPETKSPLAYPVAFSNHSALPKTYFQACGLDPLRDCTLVMEQVWKDAGVPTRLDIYPGLFHVFWVFDLPISATTKFKRDVEDGIKWLLE